MNAKQLQETIETGFKKYFPNGYINVSKLALGGGVSIFCGLIGDINDVSAKIRANDPMTFRSYIHDNITFNDEENQLGDLVLEFDGVSISCITEKPYHYCESRKMSVRKTTGSPEKIISTFDKYFKNLKSFVDELASKKQIIQQDSIPAKYL